MEPINYLKTSPRLALLTVYQYLVLVLSPITDNYFFFEERNQISIIAFVPILLYVSYFSTHMASIIYVIEKDSKFIEIFSYFFENKDNLSISRRSTEIADDLCIRYNKLNARLFIITSPHYHKVEKKSHGQFRSLCRTLWRSAGKYKESKIKRKII